MNGYVCFWKGKRCGIEAETSYKAQQLAVVEFQKSAGRRKIKSFDVSVTLAEKDGE